MLYDSRTEEVQAGTQAPPPPIPVLPAQPGAPTSAPTGQAPTTTAPVTPTGRDRVQSAADELRAAIQNEIAGRAQPGATGTAGTVPPPQVPYDPNQIPREVIPLTGIVMSMLAVIFIGTPIARAMARAMDRRGQAATLNTAGVAPQLRQLQESVDAMAIELERISEAQRFTAKLMSERAPSLSAGERSRTT